MGTKGVTEGVDQEHRREDATVLPRGVVWFLLALLFALAYLNRPRLVGGLTTVGSTVLIAWLASHRSTIVPVLAETVLDCERTLHRAISDGGVPARGGRIIRAAGSNRPRSGASRERRSNAKGRRSQGSQPPATRRHGTASNRSTRRRASKTSESTGSGFLGRFGIPRPKSWGLLCLRTSLALVLFWFGFTKLWPASPETEIVTATVTFLPQAEVVVFLGFMEALIGLLLLYRPLIRIATLLVCLQTLATQATLVFNRSGIPAEGVPGAWTVFPYLPSELGVYVLKNYVLLTAAIVVAIGYTGSGIRNPPIERLRSTAAKKGAVIVYRGIVEWLPRHALTFLRTATVVSLVGGGILTMFGHGTPLETLEIALIELDVQRPSSSVYFFVGAIQVSAGLLLCADDQRLLTGAVVLTATYLFLGLLPMLVVPDNAFYREFVGLSPAFPTLYFLKDLVVLGAVWTIRDARVPWHPRRSLYLLGDAIEVLLAWLGIGARNAPEPADTDEIRPYRDE